jgi:hypothetical protein
VVPNDQKPNTKYQGVTSGGEMLLTTHLASLPLSPMTQRTLALVLLCFLTGCASRTPQLRMMVSGPPGVAYTCNYQIGNLSGSVKTATTGGGFDTFLEIPAGDGHCEVIKDRPADEISVVAAERHPTRRINGFVPAGTRAIRFIREASIWRFELQP